MLLAGAVPIGVGVLLGSTQLMAWLQLGADMTAVPVAGLAGCAAAGLVRLRWNRQQPVDAPRLPGARWASAGAGAGALLSLAAWLPGLGPPRLPPQGNDDIWHGYLTARLLTMPELGARDVAPVLVDAATPQVFYPYGWHLLAAFATHWSPAGIPLAMNSLWVLVGVGLAFGSAVLVRITLPQCPRVAFFAGALAPTVTMFPYLVNGLAPYALALAMTPFLLAAIAHLAVGGSFRVPGSTVVLSAVAVLVSHPAAAFVAAFGATCLLGELILSRRVRWSEVLRRMTPALLATMAFAMPWLLVTRNDVGHAPQPAPLGLGWVDQVSMLLQLDTPWTVGQPALALLAGLGLVSVVRMRGAGSFAVVPVLAAAILLLVVWSGASSLLWLSTPWYGEWHRLTAALGLFVILLAALGADLLWQTLAWVRGRRWNAVARGLALGGALLFLGALTVTLLQYVARAQSIITTAWSAPGLVTEADLSLFAELDRQVGPRATVLGDWGDGSTWMFAIAGVRPVFPYAYSAVALPGLLSFGGDNLPVDVCRVLVSHRVTHALVKSAKGPQANPTFPDVVRSDPDLYVPTFEGSSGAIYRVDQDRLRACSATP